MRDMHNTIDVKRVISPVSVADNTAQVGQIIDHAGFDGAEYVIATGSVGDAGAEFTVLLEDGEVSDMSDAAAVADAYLVGTEALASFIQTADDKCFKLGYKGIKRYSRLTITPTNNATAALVAAVCLLGYPTNGTTANPPA